MLLQPSEPLSLLPMWKPEILALQRLHKARCGSSQLCSSPTTRVISDFMALDHGVLENLFGRFVAYLGRLADQISAEGVSATMERASPERVHLHAYLHLSTSFHRRGQDALNIFAFEGVRPHVTPNTASGKTYTGAVRFGHFYVVADKLGTLRLGCRCLEAYRAAWGLGTNCGLKF